MIQAMYKKISSTIDINMSYQKFSTWLENLAPRVHVRWMIRRDLEEVVNLVKNNEQFSKIPNIESTLLKILRKREIVGFVAEVNEKVTGILCVTNFNRQKIINFIAGDLYSIEALLENQKNEGFPIYVKTPNNSLVHVAMRKLGFSITNEDNYIVGKYPHDANIEVPETQYNRIIIKDRLKKAYQIVGKLQKDHPTNVYFPAFLRRLAIIKDTKDKIKEFGILCDYLEDNDFFKEADEIRAIL